MNRFKENVKLVSDYVIIFFIALVLAWVSRTVVRYLVTQPFKFLPFEFSYVPLFAAIGIVAVHIIFSLIGKCGKDIKPTSVLLILMSFLIFGTAEWLTSFVIEKMGASPPWDYHSLGINIGGRTSVLSCSIFTVSELVFTYFIIPFCKEKLFSKCIALKLAAAVIILIFVIFYHITNGGLLF